MQPSQVPRADGADWPLCGRESAARQAVREDPLTVVAAEHQSRIGAAKTEAVREHTVKFSVLTFANDRHILECRIEFFDIGAFGDEAVATQS